MKNMIRILLLLPVIVLAAVAVPSLVLQTLAADGSAWTVSQTSPLDTPTPTDPGNGTIPTATPTRQPQPTARPTRTPTPRPPAPGPAPVLPAPTVAPRTGSSDLFTVNGRTIYKVIGDRLSATIYGFAENGWLYRSNNDGRTWALVTTGALTRDFIMNAGNPLVLYSGAGVACSAAESVNAPLHRSDDGGVTWTMVRTGMNLRPLLTNPADPMMLFAADCAMIYLSPDGGRTWRAKLDVSAAALWEQYAVVDMDAAALVGDPQPAPSWAQLFALGVARTGGAVAFTGETGDSWVDITNLDQPPTAPRAVVAHQTQAGRLWVLAADGVWATANFGIDWEFLGDGLPAPLFNGGLHGLTYGLDGALYLATAQGLFTLPPGATAWEFMALPGGARRSIDSLLLTETAPGQLWLNTDDGVVRVFVGE